MTTAKSSSFSSLPLSPLLPRIWIRRAGCAVVLLSSWIVLWECMLLQTRVDYQAFTIQMKPNNHNHQFQQHSNKNNSTETYIISQQENSNSQTYQSESNVSHMETPITAAAAAVDVSKDHPSSMDVPIPRQTDWNQSTMNNKTSDDYDGSEWVHVKLSDLESTYNPTTTTSSNGNPSPSTAPITPPPTNGTDREHHNTTISNWIPSRDSPRIAFIAFTYLGKPQRFQTLMEGALNTYLVNESTYFLVMVPQWKPVYKLVCKQPDAAFCDRLTPIWVDCPEDFTGYAPCCKVEKGLMAVLDQYGSEYDYFMYMDDDNYIRTNLLKRYLHPLNPTQIFIVGSTDPRRLGLSYLNQYLCSYDDDFLYPWGQPMIYSHAALEYVSHGFRVAGFSTECLVYDLMHDVALQIYNWMYSLPALMVTHGDIDPETFEGSVATKGIHETMGYHGLLNEHHPGEQVLTLAETHNFYHNLKEPKKIRYHWHNVTGFRRTRTYRLYGDPSTWKNDTWHTVNRSECWPEDEMYIPHYFPSASPSSEPTIQHDKRKHRHGRHGTTKTRHPSKPSRSNKKRRQR